MKTLPWIIISIMLVAFSVYECNRKPTIIEHTEYIYDSVLVMQEKIKIDSFERIVYYPIIESIIDTAWKMPVIDTNAIIRDYLAEVYYKDRILIDDSSLFVMYDAMVSNNRLQWIKPSAKIRRPLTIHKTTYIEADTKARWEVSTGIFAAVNEYSSDIGGIVQFRWGPITFGYGRGVLERTNLVVASYNF